MMYLFFVPSWTAQVSKPTEISSFGHGWKTMCVIQDGYRKFPDPTIASIYVDLPTLHSESLRVASQRPSASWEWKQVRAVINWMHNLTPAPQRAFSSIRALRSSQRRLGFSPAAIVFFLLLENNSHYCLCFSEGSWAVIRGISAVWRFPRNTPSAAGSSTDSLIHQGTERDKFFISWSVRGEKKRGKKEPNPDEFVIPPWSSIIAV